MHTEQIEQKLKQINKGTSLTQDRHILSQQIRLVNQLLETDHRYYASVPALLGHAAKYHSPDLYMRIHDELNTFSQTWNDPDRTFNYVKVFLGILKKYYKLTDNKISAYMIANDPEMRQNAHKHSYHGRRQYSANTNTLAAKESYKCKLCQGDHTYLTSIYWSMSLNKEVPKNYQTQYAKLA